MSEKVTQCLTLWGGVKGIISPFLSPLFVLCFPSTVPGRSDRPSEADLSGLQGQLLSGESLQAGPEEAALQPGHQPAASPRGPAVVPVAVSGGCCAPR